MSGAAVCPHDYIVKGEGIGEMVPRSNNGKKTCKGHLIHELTAIASHPPAKPTSGGAKEREVPFATEWATVYLRKNVRWSRSCHEKTSSGKQRQGGMGGQFPKKEGNMRLFEEAAENGVRPEKGTARANCSQKKSRSGQSVPSRGREALKSQDRKPRKNQGESFTPKKGEKKAMPRGAKNHSEDSLGIKASVEKGVSKWPKALS